MDSPHPPFKFVNIYKFTGGTMIGQSEYLRKETLQPVLDWKPGVVDWKLNGKYKYYSICTNTHTHEHETDGYGR